MNILTKEAYEKAIDRYHAEEKRHLLDRFDAGARQYGTLDLDCGRDWILERREELSDARAYEIFEVERLRRLSNRERSQA